MRRLLAATAILTLASTVPVWGQRWGAPAKEGYPPYGFRVYTDWQRGSLRLDVSPDDAQVFVDNQYAGKVDDFNGAFERLPLGGGSHLVEIRKAGFTSLILEVSVFPGQKVTFSRTLQPSRGDDADAEVIAPPLAEGALQPCSDGPSGDIKLDVSPRDADVVADGIYVGRVDDFSGSQHLMFTEGHHHLVLQRRGYETLDVNLTISAERPVVYRAALKKASAH